MRKTAKERFWPKVNMGGAPDYLYCELWAAYRDKGGYGIFWFQGKQQGAHRVSWILEFGEIPEGEQVLHHCDNPPCVNPEHLYLGTPKDNMADMVKRGRHYQANKTHCDKGHPLSGDNLYINPTTGARSCKICAAECGATYRKANKEKTAARNAVYYKAKKKESRKYEREIKL